MTILFDNLNRDSGDGSRDETEDWFDKTSRIHENEWSTARTSFRITDAPAEKRDKYSNLKDTHDGKGEGDRRDTIRRTKILKDADTFCTICDLSESQKDDVKLIIDESDISSNNYGGKSYEKVILAVMSLVVDRDIDDERDFNKRLILQGEFRELMDSVGIGSRELRRVRQMVRERTGYFE